MIYIKKLSQNDGEDVFNMLKGIDYIENSYTNPTYNMDFEEFRLWLIQQDDWSSGINLPNGFVSQSIYWLYDDDQPVGMGKIRHELTDSSRICGGNIGYAISHNFRSKGYGKRFLELLLIEAKKLDLKEILLTVDKNNLPSKKICEDNGGILTYENEERFYFVFE